MYAGTIRLREKYGVAQAMVSSYELEQRSPSYDVLIKISALFNVTTDYLLGVEKSRIINIDGLGDREIEVINSMIEVLQKNTDKK